jgi:hypothetical protein
MSRYSDFNAIKALDIETGYKLVEKAFKSKHEDMHFKMWLNGSLMHGIASMLSEQDDYLSFQEYMEKVKNHGQASRILTEEDKQPIRHKASAISDRLRGENSGTV